MGRAPRMTFCSATGCLASPTPLHNPSLDTRHPDHPSPHPSTLHITPILQPSPSPSCPTLHVHRIAHSTIHDTQAQPNPHPILRLSHPARSPQPPSHLSVHSLHSRDPHLPLAPTPRHASVDTFFPPIVLPRHTPTMRSCVFRQSCSRASRPWYLWFVRALSLP